MVSRNGAHPAEGSEQHSDPSGVFGRVGASLPLGGSTVTIQILTNRQVKAQQALIDAMNYSGDGSPGEQFLDGMMQTGEFRPVAEWLAACTDRDADALEELLGNATGDEVVRLIDTIFEQTGLAWLKRAMGNRAARIRAAALMIDSLSVAGGQASSSTPSTTSSSTPPVLPPTPPSSTASTD